MNVETVFRDAAKRAHPDVGGSNDLMSKVNRAKDFIIAATEAADAPVQGNGEGNRKGGVKR